jgi:hypothetical protein
MIVGIRTGCTFRRQHKELVIPAQLPSDKRVVRLSRRCGLWFGAENEVCWIGLGERMGMGSNTSAMAGTRPGAKSGQRDFFPRLSPFPPVPLLHRSNTPLPPPPLRFFTIPCNLTPRFPLYGVEAGGLPAKATRRKEAKMDKNYNYRLLILTVTTGHAAHAMTRPIGN